MESKIRYDTRTLKNKEKMDDLEIIVLAGGKGTRMGAEIPKALTDVGGKPMISYVLDAIAGVYRHESVIVVGFQSDKVIATLGESRRYALQKEQRGTGHAVHAALSHVRPDAKHVLVLYCDHPLINTDTIRALYNQHIGNTSPITLATVKVSDFNEWRALFFDFGRIIRDTYGSIIKITEKKDATEEEKKITEVNPSYFCFDAAWLRDKINKITTDNTQGEYYLTDLVALAQQDGHKLNSLEIPAREALGVNTKEQLAMVLDFLH
jgi:bifunctional UDP-N-acetylglucosamine pyrophosphorylase/glucosamine-1-phosphate N-acetyltransferase